jgi:Tol biopolymer transport system component
MGEVYRARDTNLKRDVALKTLPPAVANDADRLARFQREAEVLASLNHPNIAQIYGLERSQGTTALAMELIEGATLEERISQGRIPVEEALRIANQIADALEAAHERGIVHRDLKPSNIKLRPDGTVKVLDFGIAKLDTRGMTGPGPAALTTPAMTEAGFVLGTAAYMSPEQARGKAVDRRTDIWAFGCVLYEMLSGDRAFPGEDVTSTLALVLQGSVDFSALPSEVTAAVRRTLELCFEKDERKRIADMRDVKLALAGVFATPTLARKQPLWRRAVPVASLVVGALLAGAYLESFRGSRVPVAPAEPVAPLAVSRFIITPPPSAPLANLGGFDLAISPDGRRIAYFAENTDRKDVSVVSLYVRELDELVAKRIPEADVIAPVGGDINPFFSADGRSIGFNSPERGGLVRVGVDGSPPQKMGDVSEPFLGATWTADNKLILSPGYSIVRRPVNGGTDEPLTPTVTDGYVMNPTILPGGRAVLVGKLQDNVESIGVVDLDTGQQKMLIENGANPTYAASGHIVFARGTTLMAAPFDAAELSLKGDPVPVIDGVRHPNSTTAADYALSANGTLAYVATTGSNDVERAALVWVDRSGKAVARAVDELIESPHDPRLSPDGMHVAVSVGLYAQSQIWSYDLRGRPPVPLAGNGAMAVWRADGQEVVFAALGAGGRFVTVAGDGSTLAPKPFGDGRIAGAAYFWSVAGDLFFVPFPIQGSPDIKVASASSPDSVRDAVVTQYQEYDPALSPNGRWLAYVSNRTGRPEVWVQGYPDGAPMRVSANGGYEPRWSVDGKALFYLQGTAMMAAAVQTEPDFSFATPVQLFPGGYATFPDPFIFSYDVARDGRFLMIQPEGKPNAAQSGASIVVVQNFAEELKRRVRPSGR